MPIAAQTMGFAPDCIWSGVAVAWIDEDGNGIRETNEPSLSEVMFFVDDTLNGYERVGRGESNWHGEAEVTVWLPGCPEASFEVYPQIPEGYKLTTGSRIAADVRENGLTLEFGFDYLSGIPTVTPRPPSPQCTSHKIGTQNHSDLTDVEVGPDGTVWVATFGNGVARFASGKDEWTRYTVKDGLISNRVRSISISGDNVAWFATNSGVSRFDGTEWISYTVEDGLIGGNVYAVTFGTNNDVWFATQEGASHYDISTGIWQSYTIENGLADNFLHEIVVMPDNSVWFFTLLHGISVLVYEDDLSGGSSWSVHSEYNYIDDITIAPDGSFWFAGSINSVDRYDPATEKWRHYEVGVAYALEAAEDGSIWIASGGYGDIVIYRLPSGAVEDFQDVLETYDAEHDNIIPDESLVDNDHPQALSISPDGTLWIGTLETATHCVFP
jgi:streptogramin lyase